MTFFLQNTAEHCRTLQNTAEDSVRGSAWLAGSECQSVGRAGYLLILLQAGDGLQHVRM